MGVTGFVLRVAFYMFVPVWLCSSSLPAVLLYLGQLRNTSFQLPGLLGERPCSLRAGNCPVGEPEGKTLNLKAIKVI